MPPEPRALLCDLDGTLVDSRKEVDDAWRAFAARHGLDEGEVLAATFAGPSREVVAAVAPWLDVDAETRSWSAPRWRRPAPRARSRARRS